MYDRARWKSLLVGAGALFVALAATQPATTQSALDSGKRADAAAQNAIDLFNNVLRRVRARHISNPDEAELIEAAIQSMLGSVDPRATWFDAQGFQLAQSGPSPREAPGGIGAEITRDGAFIKIVTPFDESPAARAGLLSGDRISSIDGESTRDMSVAQAITKLRGLVGEKVSLTVFRADERRPREFEIVREITRLPPVQMRFEGEDIAVFRVAAFDPQTAEGVRAALARFGAADYADRLKGFVLDLRNSSGGGIDPAIDVASAFLDGGEVVSIEGRSPDQTRRFPARGSDASGKKPLIVLVNAGTASAAEIVAGALHDNKRATLVGVRTFGQGYAQTLIPLGENKGGLRLATGRYVTPSGHVIHGKGIEPDVSVLQAAPKDGVAEADAQLAAALDLLRGVKKAGDFPRPETKAN